jgi:phosphoglycolate phosphatase-like HAD superfamily hydrolase
VTQLVLWDLDGTLLRCGEVTNAAFAAVLSELVGDYTFTAEPMDYSGLTDPVIAAAVLEHVGADPALLDDLLRLYAAEMARRHLEIRATGTVMPFAHETLAALGERGLHQGVVTGNVASTARVKVAAFGFDAHLDMDAGAYGDDGPSRDHLVPIALARAASPDPTQVWVVGDTARDLACARVAGVKCLLVATGGVPLEVLEGLGADAVLPDLEHALDVLL